MNWYKRGKNKFNNNTCRCLSKHIHDSRGESNYCDYLLAELKDGKIKEYKQQVSYDLVVNGKKICRHIVDFIVIDNDGNESVHEYKGFATDVWRLKMKLWEATRPEIPYIVIKHGKQR